MTQMRLLLEDVHITYIEYWLRESSLCADSTEVCGGLGLDSARLRFADRMSMSIVARSH